MSKQGRLNPTDFYDQQVLPALFGQLDQAFLEFGWHTYLVEKRSFPEDKLEELPFEGLRWWPSGDEPPAEAVYALVRNVTPTGNVEETWLQLQLGDELKDLCYEALRDFCRTVSKKGVLTYGKNQNQMEPNINESSTRSQEHKTFYECEAGG